MIGPGRPGRAGRDRESGPALYLGAHASIGSLAHGGNRVCLAVALAACSYVDSQTHYWVRNDSDSIAMVRFGGTPDHPEMYAFSVPAGGDGIIHLTQGWLWKGRIGMLDNRCHTEWTELIDVAGAHHAWADDIEGGSLVIAKDRTVTWALVNRSRWVQRPHHPPTKCSRRRRPAAGPSSPTRNDGRTSGPDDPGPAAAPVRPDGLAV